MPTQDPYANIAHVYTGAAKAAKPTQYASQGQVALPNDGQVTAADSDDPYSAIAQPVDHSYSTQLMKDVPSGLAQAGIGALKGLGSTALGAASMVGKIPGMGLPQQGVDAARARLTPSNDIQSLGKGVEQAGEFMVPGLGEEAATAQLGKYAPLARVGYNALASGSINKLQGGSFSGGTLAGGIAGGLTEGFRAAAPTVAETALGVRGTDRRFGRTPGQAILSETTGFNPGRIASQAQDKSNLYTAQKQTLLANSPNSIDITPARQIAGSAQTAAALQNEPGTIKRVNQLASQLNKEHGSAAAIPPQIRASRALDLQRGISAAKGSWTTPNDFADSTAGRLYGSLGDSIESAVPETAGLNQKISSLIPVSQRAGAADLNANTLQRVFGRLARPTGAMAGGLFGAGAGYKQGGWPGALAGGAFGLVAPEVLASPRIQMFIARGMASAAPPVVRVLTGTAMQATRKQKGLYDPQ